MCAACDNPNVESDHRLHPPTAGPVDPILIDDLVSAYRILASEGVLDSFGHVSIRHPDSPERYLIARSIAPGSVTAADIMEFDLDSVPVDQRGRGIYMERFIHGEIYKLRSDVTAIVHSHSPTVIPFSVTTTPLRAIFHNASFLGQGAPVFNSQCGRRTQQYACRQWPPWWGARQILGRCARGPDAGTRRCRGGS